MGFPSSGGISWCQDYTEPLDQMVTKVHSHADFMQSIMCSVKKMGCVLLLSVSLLDIQHNAYLGKN